MSNVATAEVAPQSAVGQIAAMIDSPEIAALVSGLEATRWTGRPGYPIRTMVGVALAKSVYALPTWNRTVALVREHGALRLALGCTSEADVPRIDACYRFTRKLRTFKGLLDDCIGHVTASLRKPSRYGPRCSHRRVGPSRLPQRAALRVEERR